MAKPASRTPRFLRTSSAALPGADSFVISLIARALCWWTVTFPASISVVALGQTTVAGSGKITVSSAFVLIDVPLVFSRNSRLLGWTGKNREFDFG
jgi:hypothetical protein